MRWNKVTIVGVGLLGGSLGLALKRRRLAGEVAGYVRRTASIKDCERVGALDYATTDLLAAVSGADLVILCTPLAQMRSLARQLLPALKRGAIVTDVGSVKASVIKDVESLITKGGAHFVGSHPMAGGEQMGVRAARADLFQNALCTITPTRKTNRAALRKVTELWEALGGRALSLTPALHDLLVSRSSHLPHVLAYLLAAQVLGPKRPKHQSALCANSFRDMTRIASSSPEMWRDIALANRRHLTKALDEFVAGLQSFRKLLTKNDAQAVGKFFETGKGRRDHWRAQGVSPSPG